MCLSHEIDTDVIIKAIALLMSLALSMVIPALLADHSQRYAVEEHLLPDAAEDPSAHEKLKRLFEWRDLVGALIVGVFVLDFAAADKLKSSCAVVADLASIIAFGVVPVVLLTCSVFARTLAARRSKSRLGYWLVFAATVLPSYFISAVLVFSS